jgi:hypothetical protein
VRGAALVDHTPAAPHVRCGDTPPGRGPVNPESEVETTCDLRPDRLTVRACGRGGTHAV